MNFGLEIKIEKIYIEKLNSEKNVIMIIFNFKDNNSNKEWKVEKTYDVLINFLSTILYFFNLEKIPLIENFNENNFNIYLINLEKYLNNIFNLPEIYNFEQIRMFFDFNLNINNDNKNTFINLFNINIKNKNKEIIIKKIKLFENKLFIHYDFIEKNNNFFNFFSSSSSKSIFEILEINKNNNYNEYNYNTIYSNEFDNKILKFFIQNKNYVIISFENGKIIILKENKIFYNCNYNKNIKKIFFNEIKGYLYILSYNSKNIDIIEINYNKLIEKIFLSKNSIEKIIFNENNNLIFLLSNNFLYCYNLEKKLFINSIFLEFEIKSFFIKNNYNENTIIFYNNNNEIYFYNFINEKFIFKRKINCNNNIFNFNLENDSKIFYNNYENNNFFGIYDKKTIKIYKFNNYFYSEENRINKEINNYYFYDEIFNLNDINNKTNNNLKGNILKIKKFFSNQNIETKENNNNINKEKNIENKKLNIEEQNSESTKYENNDSENENSLDGWEEEIPIIINRVNNINLEYNINNINLNNDINEQQNDLRNSYNSYSYQSNNNDNNNIFFNI